jgi:glycosyltransferase involved in cell wall biosynthesis
MTARQDGPLATEIADAGVVRYDLDARRLSDPRALIRLLRLVRRERIDLLHAHGQDASILAALARCLCGFPLVITRHVMEEPAASRRQRLRARAACAAFRRADAVVAVSRAVAGRLAELSGLPRQAIHVIPNGIELERFDRAAPEARQQVAVGPDELVILVPAALRDGKGHEVLLRALPALRARVPAVRVLFAGAGEREATLRREARGAGDAVCFLGLRTDIPDLLSACDLVVLPSATRADGTVEEALPTVLLEAAAGGRPVVATRVGGVEEIVQDGRTGLLVPPGDAAALAGAMAALLLDRQRARMFGRAGRGLARTRFGIATLARRTLQLWDRVAALRSAQPAARWVCP